MPVPEGLNQAPVPLALSQIPVPLPFVFMIPRLKVPY